MKRIACLVVGAIIALAPPVVPPARAAEKPATRDQISPLIDQLGDNDFKKREEASRQLLARGPSALPALKEALQREDFEIVSRARALISKIQGAIVPGGPLDPNQPLRLRIGFENGARILTVRQGDSRIIRIVQGPDGIIMSVTGRGADGVLTTQEFRAADVQQLRADSPDACDVYEQCIAVDPVGLRLRPPVRIDPRPIPAGWMIGPAAAPDELDLLRVRLEGQMRRNRVDAGDREKILGELEQLAAARGAEDMQRYAAHSDALRKTLDELKLDPGDLLPPPAKSRLGVSVAPDLDGNLAVRRIARDSRAAKLGLQVGDVILRIEGEAIRDIAGLRRAVSAKEAELTLEVNRDGRDVKLTER